MRKTFIQQTILFIFLLAISTNNLNAQGKTTLVDGHHLAGVNLTLGISTEIPLNYFIKQQGSSLSNPIPGFNIDVPFSDGNITIKGIMSDAALAIDWWTLFGEPAEQYLFTWKAKDYYEIISLDATGSSTIKRTVNKNDLKKYPDLFLRYENIKPTEIEFEIQWGLEDKDVFDKTGMSFTSYYGVKNSFKTKVSSASILIEPSGKTPFGVPGIRQGKGEAFLGLENNFPKDKLQGLMQMFTKAPYQYINAVIVTKIKWPVVEMKAIADKFDQYERGEATPSPTQIINEELRKNQNLTAYNNNDFWGDVYEDENVNISLEIKGSEYTIKNNNKSTFKTDKFYLGLFSKNKGYYNPNTGSKYLFMWGGSNENYTSGFKHKIYGHSYYIIDYKGNIFSIDGKTNFESISASKNEQELYEALYFTDEWTYVRDICYTAGSGGLKLGKIAINNSFDEAKAKLLSHNDNESGCTNGRGWSKYGVGKYTRYFFNDKMQVINKKTEYHVIQVYNK
jgi:hypothetical protein